MSRLSFLMTLPPNKVTFWFTNNRVVSYPLSHRYPHLRGASIPYRPLFTFVASIPDPCTQAYEADIQDIPSITQLSRTLHNEQINHFEPESSK